MQAAQRAAYFLQLVVLILGTGSCSVLVDPESLVIRCQVSPFRESEDPCLIAGMHCVASECKPCENASEICNGVDDDCDGVVDNGHDEDNDGFTWCGGGRSELADCAPTDPGIHPAGPVGLDGTFIAAPVESCDGKDNDCDSKVDEAPECATTDACERDSDCPEGQVCPESTGICIEPRPVGSGCTSDAECAGGFCVKMGEYTVGTPLTDNRCASACCTDADCVTGSLCVAGPAGVRVCLPSNIVARAAGVVGDRCTRDMDCASGNCVLGRCATACVGDGACASESICTLSAGSLSEPRSWTCGEARGRYGAGTACSGFDPAACRSGLCTDAGSCAQPCGRDADCSRGETCVYQATRALVVGPTSIVSYCAAASSQSERPSTSLCCTNADCGTGGQCAPYALEGGFWVMNCR